MLRICCKRLSTRLFGIAYSRAESEINRRKITARSTNGDHYTGTNCQEIAACSVWHSILKSGLTSLQKSDEIFPTSLPVPNPDLETGGGLQKIFFPALWASVWSKNKEGGHPLDPPLMTMPFPDFS